MTRSFEMLVKDNTLIQREVMHEYDAKVRHLQPLPSLFFLTRICSS